MVHYNACPLCSSVNIGLQFVCTDHFVSKKEFPVYKCSACDFTFTQDYPEENEIGKFYESESYISHSDISEGFYNKLYRIARKFMLRKKKNFINNITGIKTGNLLDVGSGTGYFVSEMNRAGWKAKGIEINDAARQFSISHFGLEILTPDEISTLKSNSYDCITLWHVLEHFHDPLKYISEISNLLKPGAICVIALPNCSSFDALHYRKFWAAWDVPRHLWHFNPSTFSFFSKKSGLILEEIRDLPLDVIYISTLSEKYKKSTLPFLTGMLKAFIFAILSALNKRRSSSLIYILRKPTG